MRSPAMLSGIVTTASQFSLITSFGNYVAAPGSGPVHISVNGQGRYANLERDTTVGAISANIVLKVPEIVVDDDAKFTFLNNHPAFQSDTAAVFYQAPRGSPQSGHRGSPKIRPTKKTLIGGAWFHDSVHSAGHPEDR